MRTQSRDTHPDAERVHVLINRAFSPARKFALVCGMYDAAAAMSQRAFHLPERRIAALYGSPWARRYTDWRRRHPDIVEPPPNLATMLRALSDRLQQRGVGFAFAGAVACGLYGMPSAFATNEIMVNTPRKLIISPAHLRSSSTYLDAERIAQHILRFEPAIVQRARLLPLIEGEPPLPVIAPDDLILHALDRFERRGGRDETLYFALLGVLKVQAPAIDVSRLLQKGTNRYMLLTALKDAGIIV